MWFVSYQNFSGGGGGWGGATPSKEENKKCMYIINIF